MWTVIKLIVLYPEEIINCKHREAIFYKLCLSWRDDVLFGWGIIYIETSSSDINMVAF